MNTKSDKEIKCDEIRTRIANLIDLTKGLTFHHTSLCRGYVSRVSEKIVHEKYDGRFGKGIKVFSPNFDSTQYCFVSYWV